MRRCHVSVTNPVEKKSADAVYKEAKLLRASVYNSEKVRGCWWKVTRVDSEEETRSHLFPCP